MAFTSTSQVSARTGGSRRIDPIWSLGFRYFLAYIPYSLLIKALTSGLVPGVPKVFGYTILPLAAVATWVLMSIIVWRLDWWRYVERRQVFGVSVPIIRWQSVIAGVCTALIVATTTLAFSLPGVSIVLVLVAMRGGVLIIARVTDFMSGRRVKWDAMAAFALTLGSLVAAFATATDFTLTAAAVGTIGLYLFGYVFRLRVIDMLGKTSERDTTIRYFVEEQAVAMPVQLLLTLLIPLFVGGEVGNGLWAGIVAVPGPLAGALFLLVGALYATLYVFGTQIYLHPREHTFCVPVNRACSILSGVVASFTLMLLFNRPAPRPGELVGAGLLLAALALLAVVAAVRERRAEPVRRLFLFICAGNTARSPMAQAICTAEIAARLGVTIGELASAGIELGSAGIAARTGKPMKPEAIAALESLGVAAHDHVARPLTPELISEAEAIYCMTGEQRQAVIDMMPEAADRVHCLSNDGDMDEPTGLEAMVSFALSAREHLRRHVAGLIPEPQLA